MIHITGKIPKRVYDIHCISSEHWGGEELTLKEAMDKAVSFGVTMVEHFIANGLNDFEASNPTAAVIFDITTEDVVMVEKL